MHKAHYLSFPDIAKLMSKPLTVIENAKPVCPQPPVTDHDKPLIYTFAQVDVPFDQIFQYFKYNYGKDAVMQ